MSFVSRTFFVTLFLLVEGFSVISGQCSKIPLALDKNSLKQLLLGNWKLHLLLSTTLQTHQGTTKYTQTMAMAPTHLGNIFEIFPYCQLPMENGYEAARLLFKIDVVGNSPTLLNITLLSTSNSQSIFYFPKDAQRTYIIISYSSSMFVAYDCSASANERGVAILGSKNEFLSQTDNQILAHAGLEWSYLASLLLKEETLEKVCDSYTIEIPKKTLKNSSKSLKISLIFNLISTLGFLTIRNYI